jgi:hypothetical protein
MLRRLEAAIIFALLVLSTLAGLWGVIADR